MAEYAMVGVTDKDGLRIKRHFGTIKWVATSRHRQHIKANFVNSYGSPVIYKRNRRIFEKLIKIINKEYNLENLAITSRSGNRYFISRRTKGRFMPKLKRVIKKHEKE